MAFCDVNEKKIGTVYHNAAAHTSRKIIHFREATLPLICCVAMDRTEGKLEANVKSLGGIEGDTVWHVV